MEQTLHILIAIIRLNLYLWCEIMDNKLFMTAYRSSLYEGLLAVEKIPSVDWNTLKTIKIELDRLEPEFLKNKITSDDLANNITKLLKPTNQTNTPMSISRDLCILKCMAVGALICAAWVASGGTLIIGSAVAGITISQPIIAALAGGASAATIACKLGKCGGC